jgi:hypothetical protein
VNASVGLCLAGATLLSSCGGGQGEEDGGAAAETTARTGVAAAQVDTIQLQRNARELEAAVEASLPTYDSITGRGQAGDLTYSYTAYFEGDSLRLIRERQDSGDYGHSDNDYYFTDGALSYYVQGQISRVVNPGGPPTSSAIVIRLYFDSEERLVHAERTLNAVPVPLEGYEELSVRRRSAALREAALAGGGRSEVAGAEPSGPIVVEFEPGTATAVYPDRVVAREVRNYVISAKKGQRLSVDLEAESRYAQFVVQYVGQSVYDSRRSAERSWSDELPRDGDYTVRVYLVRADAQRGGVAEYELTLELEGEAEGRRSN